METRAAFDFRLEHGLAAIDEEGSISDECSTLQYTALLLQIELDTALGRLEVVVSVRGCMLEELVFLENLLAETDLILSTRL